jgi:hypothetical protein
MPSYASFNVALSLCMIMAVIALLVGRSQSFASPRLVLSMSSTRVRGMTPDRVKRLARCRDMVDFMPVDQVRAWPEYKSIGQAGI